MTRQRIIEGLELLVLQLANGQMTATPDGWDSLEWVYLKGVASAAVLGLQRRLKEGGRK